MGSLEAALNALEADILAWLREKHGRVSIERVLSGPGLAEQLISRYERHIACTRLPALRETMRRNLRQRAEAVAEAIEKSGRSVHIELVCTLICAVDGSVVAALVEGRDPSTVAMATVVDLIDVLAPIDERPVRI